MKDAIMQISSKMNRLEKEIRNEHKANSECEVLDGSAQETQSDELNIHMDEVSDDDVPRVGKVSALSVEGNRLRGFEKSK
jgi:hypothetical protein